MNTAPDRAISQKEMIRDHLKTHGSITPLTALEKYGCMRLGARIGELKKDGFPVTSTMKELPSGKRVAEYYYHGCDSDGQYSLFKG